MPQGLLNHPGPRKGHGDAGTPRQLPWGERGRAEGQPRGSLHTPLVTVHQKTGCRWALAVSSISPSNWEPVESFPG